MSWAVRPSSRDPVSHDEEIKGRWGGMPPCHSFSCTASTHAWERTTTATRELRRSFLNEIVAPVVRISPTRRSYTLLGSQGMKFWKNLEVIPGVRNGGTQPLGTDAVLPPGPGHRSRRQEADRRRFDRRPSPQGARGGRRPALGPGGSERRKRRRHAGPGPRLPRRPGEARHRPGQEVVGADHRRRPRRRRLPAGATPERRGNTGRHRSVGNARRSRKRLVLGVPDALSLVLSRSPARHSPA